jgi:hypothetical protein
MAIDPAARQELERRMEERRAYLGLRWREVADLAKLTTEGIRGVRKGPSEIPAYTRRAIERALEWERGEVDRILGQGVLAHDPSDEEIAAMTSRQLAEYALHVEKTRGAEARRDWLQHAYSVWQNAVDTLVSEYSE